MKDQDRIGQVVWHKSEYFATAVLVHSAPCLLPQVLLNRVGQAIPGECCLTFRHRLRRFRVTTRQARSRFLGRAGLQLSLEVSFLDCQ